MPSAVVITGSWRKSSFSGDENCVTVAPSIQGAAVIDSKHGESDVLAFTSKAWTGLVQAVGLLH
ncbi:DUF397 domain-containing protein [Embleya sp. AB8]|uniref:DUF397 domain-containing protein n=1 Tax=Embleya sp. AB8 TaxID=3156304 RepID=UPI003C748C54